MSVQEKMTAIAEAIRTRTGETKKLGLDEMAAGVDTVYDKGYEEGYTGGYEAGQVAGWSDGYDTGYTEGETDGYCAGRQTQYDTFWDAFQDNGNKVSYDQCFAYGNWNDTTFQPKYDILCQGTVGGRQMFYGRVALTDVKVPIRCTDTRMVYAFQNCVSLVTIPLIEDNGVTDYTNAFTGCTALENITFAGTISVNLSMESCGKLTRASIESIISCLSDTTEGKTLTLNRTAVDNGFGYYENGQLEFEGCGTPEWQALVDSKPNWSIVLY